MAPSPGHPTAPLDALAASGLARSAASPAGLWAGGRGRPEAGLSFSAADSGLPRDEWARYPRGWRSAWGGASALSVDSEIGRLKREWNL